MFKWFMILPAAALLLPVSAQCQTVPPAAGSNKLHPALDTLRIEILPAEDSTWGYDIFRGGRRYIHQPMIPGASGARGFTTPERARGAAALVCAKIRAGITPPTITVSELRDAALID